MSNCQDIQAMALKNGVIDVQFENQDRVLAEDSRQQIVEIIGLSYFLKERRRFLEGKLRAFRISPEERDELLKLREALSIATSKSSDELPSIDLLHSNEAGFRLARHFKEGIQLTNADYAYACAMAEFPEDIDGSTARRAAFLRAMQVIRLASAHEARELASLIMLAPAANT